MMLKNVKSYKTFLNENNLSDYSINEGLNDNIKEKISSLWNKLSFRNKIDISEKIVSVVSKTKLSLCVSYMLYFLIVIADEFTDKIDLQNTRWISNSIFWLIYLSTTFIESTTKKLRKKIIREKVQEMRERFDPQWFTYIYVLIGKNKDILEAIQRMKYDDLLNDEDILITDDIVLIDLSGYFIEKKEHDIKDDVVNVIDPYHEEAWTDEEERIAEDPNSLKNRVKRIKICPMNYIERLYNIKFRSINNIQQVDDKIAIHNTSFHLTNNQKEKLKRDRAYRRSLDEYKDEVNDI